MNEKKDTVSYEENIITQQLHREYRKYGNIDKNNLLNHSNDYTIV